MIYGEDKQKSDSVVYIQWETGSLTNEKISHCISYGCNLLRCKEGQANYAYADTSFWIFFYLDMNVHM